MRRLSVEVELSEIRVRRDVDRTSMVLHVLVHDCGMSVHKSSFQSELNVCRLDAAYDISLLSISRLQSRSQTVLSGTCNISNPKNTERFQRI